MLFGEWVCGDHSPLERDQTYNRKVNVAAVRQIKWENNLTVESALFFASGFEVDPRFLLVVSSDLRTFRLEQR